MGCGESGLVIAADSPKTETAIAAGCGIHEKIRFPRVFVKLEKTNRQCPDWKFP
jgi:hypothetical protein